MHPNSLNNLKPYAKDDPRYEMRKHPKPKKSGLATINRYFDAQGYTKITKEDLAETIRYVLGLPMDALEAAYNRKDCPLAVKVIIETMMDKNRMFAAFQSLKYWALGTSGVEDEKIERPIQVARLELGVIEKKEENDN